MGLPDSAKSLIAPARYSDGPMLFLICQENENLRIHEHLPCGTCQVWPELAERGVQEAEEMIYEHMSPKD